MTENVVDTMRKIGVDVDGAEDLASVTALECFKVCETDEDGKLHVEEFKNWFYAPKSDPAYMFGNIRKIVE
jgi:hypothetical protein